MRINDELLEQLGTVYVNYEFRNYPTFLDYVEAYLTACNSPTIQLAA